MSAVLNLRGFTREEAARFKAQAAARGLTLSRYLVWLSQRDTLFDALNDTYKEQNDG